MTQIFFITVLMITFVNCGGYNTDFTPPNENTKLDEVFPQKISEWKRESLKEKEIHGQKAYAAIYGEDKSILQLILFPDKATADAYFKKYMVPEIDSMKNHSRGKINGKWYASGKDGSGRKYYRWVNTKYIFTINAETSDIFESTVGEFKYISKK